VSALAHYLDESKKSPMCGFSTDFSLKIKVSM
jgi:glutaredoxin-related protein